MSRSLRTRPMTLYAQDAQQPSNPPVSASTSYPQPSARDSSSQVRSSSKVLKKSKKKASEVGNNLKKRLSTRYAEPTQLDAGGFSAVPSVPSLPTFMPQIRIDEENEDDLAEGEEGRNRGYATSDGRLMPSISQDLDRHLHGSASNALADGSLPAGGSTQEALLRSTNRKASFDTIRSQTERFEDDPAIDLELLAQPDFDPQAYLRAKLSQHSESSLRTFKSSLASTKQAANDDLKRQVFKNYSEFITISKEIATLENDMLELKELLSEWKQLPQALELDDSIGGPTSFSDSFAARSRGGASGGAAGAAGRRNSTLDLQQIYRAQITSLWEGIEGSQKFLPYIPGRHLIAEASSFTELNAATYKPQQGVGLFLLDDLLLIASRKKRQMSSKVRLVAERCFNLAEIVVIDLKDGGDLTNAIKIKRGKESYVYRTDRPEDKKALLNAFRRVAQELAKKRRNENDAEMEARKRESTLLSSSSSSPSHLAHSLSLGLGRSTDLGSISSMDNGSLLTPIGEDGPAGESASSLMATAAATAASERKDPGRWNNDFADELSVCIALREWEEAVNLIEKGKGVLSTYSRSEFAYMDLSTKLSTRTGELIHRISMDFVRQPNLKKSNVVKNVQLLLRLDEGEKARELFLTSRTELLKRRVRQIKFEGDLSLYISELGVVYFSFIKNTSEWYMVAFNKDTKMASGFVSWAIQQIMNFTDLFKRQVYSGNTAGSATIKSIRNVTSSLDTNTNSNVDATVRSKDFGAVGQAKGSQEDEQGEEEEEERMKRSLLEISTSCSEQLKEVGLDFSYLIHSLLQPPPSPLPPANTKSNPTTTDTTSTATTSQGSTSGKIGSVNEDASRGATKKQPHHAQTAIPSLMITAPSVKNLSTHLSTPPPSAQEIRRQSVLLLQQQRSRQ